MNTNLLSCCSFPQIKFSFPLNIFHFLEKFCTVYSNVQAWSVFYHNKVFCSFPYFFSLYLFFLFQVGWREEKAGSSALSCFSLAIICDVGHGHKGQEGERSAGMRLSRVRQVDQTCWLPGKGPVDAQHVQLWTWMGKDSSETQKEGHPSHPDWVSGTTSSALLPLSVLSFSPAPPFVLCTPLSQGSGEAWQPVSDGRLMGRANCFLCFVQMYK